jgi:alanyl-tRNA synthetase
MGAMTSAELRRQWTDFWSARDHTIVRSASLIPTHPTAPMFTNSGMMQFVPYFLGEEPVPYDPPRAASVQKCVRAGGKHNDLDAIGRSLRHLSFFEMLGNFSFGDYFKAEAIPWAWEFVTEVLGIDGDRVWITVHVDDDEAEDIWSDAVGVPRERIQRLDKDNFWEMGDTGPCGPSSELFFDFGPEHGPDGGPANPAAETRFVEFYNNVFPQYLRHPDGHLTDLEAPGIDVGVGLERVLGTLQGVPSLYAADTLTALIGEAESVTGHRLGESDLGDIALRLLADHSRTMSFLVADGVIPSNEDRGYVLRRIIRRAIRFAYILGVETEVTPPLVERCIDLMGADYPELVDGHDLIVGIVTREEERFRQTLKTGSQILDTALDRLDHGGTLPGDVAFQLHDTYGFPLEVTQEVADLRGFDVDVDGFEAEMAAQRTRAKAARKTGGAVVGNEVDELARVLADHGPTEFTGREEYESKATVLAVLRVRGDGAPGSDRDSIILDRTPFYAESGGQIGDTGRITTETGSAEVVDTTYALPGLHRHVVGPIEGEISVGQTATATIDGERRDAVRRNHTGTHVLHWALREVLGEHVKQQGSLVAPDRLRFDFTHFAAVTPEQIAAIEDLANREILHNAPVRHYETTMDHAREVGAIAFFGEKYGEIVRVLEAGEHSVELCGGTHVRALGDIGPVKIVSEGSIGSNIRRLEAITGTGPIERLRREEELLAQVAAVLGVPVEDLIEGAAKRVEEIKALRDEMKELRKVAAGSRAADLEAAAVDGLVIARVDGTGREELRDMAVALRDRPGIRAVVLGGAPDGGGAALVAAAAPDSGLDASALLADAKASIKGGGGGNATLATAGGKDVGGIDVALEQARAAAGL